jgi:hypothetical protein
VRIAGADIGLGKDEIGFITFEAPAGDHIVQVSFEKTENIGWMMSSLTVTIITLYPITRSLQRISRVKHSKIFSILSQLTSRFGYYLFRTFGLPRIMPFSITNMSNSRCRTCYTWNVYRKDPEEKSI